MPVMDKDINCINWRGLLAFIDARYGPAAVETLLEGLIDNPRYLVQDKMDPSRQIPVGRDQITDPAYWVSNAFSLALLHRVNRVVDTPNPLYDAGVGAVGISLSRSALFVGKLMGPAFLAHRAAAINARFNRTKDVRVSALTGTGATIELQYRDGFAVTKDVCNWNLGIYAGLMDAAGLKGVHAEESRCRVDGDDCCEIRLRWRRTGVFRRLFKGVVTRLLVRDINEISREYDDTVRDRDRLIDALSASERRYRTVFDCTGTANAILEADGSVSLVNDEFEKLSGYTRVEVEGRMKWMDFLDPADGKRVLDHIVETRRRPEDRATRFEVRIRQRNGRFRDILCKTGRMPGTERVVVSALDVTETRQAAERLRASEQRYRTLFEDSMEAMSLTRDGRIVDVNPAWLALHGYDAKAEVVGKDIIAFIHHEDRGALHHRRETWRGAARGVFRMRDLRRDGRSVAVEVYSSVLEIDDVEMILATIRDVTAIREAERARAELESRLQQAEKMEVVGTLAGGVAHDLNNILSGIVSYPELLLLQLPDDSPLRGPLQTINTAGQRAAAVVQDLLTLARRGMATTSVFDLNDVIRKFLNAPAFKQLLSANPGLAVDVDLAGSGASLSGSRAHMEKVVKNLLVNAAESLPDGGTVTISTSMAYLDTPPPGYDAVVEGDYVRLQVRDTGDGMSAEATARVFEPFYMRKHMGRGGTGLGMAVVWGVVEDHHGYITVSDAPGRGTAFDLWFPTAGGAPAPEAPAPKLRTGGGETILVVDDTPSQLEIAAGILTQLGYRAHTVESGEAALAWLADHSADLIVLDMIMAPGMDGLETFRRVRRRRPDQRAIVASGYAATDRVAEILRMGASRYLKKPYTLAEMADAVRAALDA